MSLSNFDNLGSVQVLHKRRRGGRGVWPHLLMLLTPLRGGGGVPEQNAYVILELSDLPLRSSCIQTHICLNLFYGHI